MRFVVVGGGVAGVCCAEELCRLCPHDSVALVSAGTVLKGVSVVARLSRAVEELQLVEKRLDELPYPNLRLVQGVAAGVERSSKELVLASGEREPYDQLCICAGARPKQLPPSVYRSSIASSADASTASTPPGDSSWGRAVDLQQPSHSHAQGQGQPQRGQHEQQREAQQQRQQEQPQQQQPQQPQQAEGEELAAMQRRVLTIRDTHSVARLAQRLPGARRVVVVGNGGIALELISALPGAHITWVMRHAHIGDAFFDLDAAQFLLEELQLQRAQQAQQPQQTRDQQGGHGQAQQQPPVTVQDGGGRAGGGGSASGVLGHAVGPCWVHQLPAGGATLAGGTCEVDLEYGCEVASIQLVHTQPRPLATHQGSPVQPPAASALQATQHACAAAAGPAPRPEPALLVALTNGKRVEADLVVLAIGVTPALDWVPPEVERAPDGGLRVNRHMQTSDPAIYAAGDSAACEWAAGEAAHWFQMRLWSQARSMGVYAAHCMAGVQEQTGADMAFELFTHVTRFLGHKVVLLGLYNGQRLQGEPADDIVCYSRITEGPERTFVRVLLLRGRVQGAVLIGDTDLEETFENLIMDQLDVGSYGPALLDPDFELDHVFD